MNERIRELYKQAAQFGQDDYNNRRRNRGPLYEEDELTNIVNQKFAELIVRECSEEIRKQGTDWIDWQPSQQGIRPEYVAMAEHIKQHFGVQE
jgi:hypothetical protein